jgi:hypothetical protein
MHIYCRTNNGMLINIFGQSITTGKMISSSDTLRRFEEHAFSHDFFSVVFAHFKEFYNLQ